MNDRSLPHIAERATPCKHCKGLGHVRVASSGNVYLCPVCKGTGEHNDGCPSQENEA